MRSRPLAVALLAAALAVSGCAGSQRSLDLEEIVVEAQPDANGNSAVAVDVALALQPGVGEQLAKLTAADWFKRRAQLQRDNPDGLSVMSWELVPGQTATAKAKGHVVDAYVFAAYGSAGDHRARLTIDGRKARVLLQSSDFLVEALTKRER